MSADQDARAGRSVAKPRASVAPVAPVARSGRLTLRRAAARALSAAASFALIALAPAAAAQAPPPPGAYLPYHPDAPLLRLDAQATREVVDDTAVATLFAEREGAQPAGPQAAVNAALQDALAELRRDPALVVHSGTYFTQPRYGRDGRIEGWRVRGELVVESTEIAAVSRAAGAVAGRLSVGSIGFRLSAERRAQAEAALTTDAAARLHERARAAARALGFAGAELVDAALVSSNPRLPVAMARAAPMLAGDAAALPVEPGRSQVSVGFTGTFRLRRSP